ncbi:LPD7 domain-containing protein [Pantoea septica]|uniref:LPD7 domain-containing protein n=1 Tax=Pantoea septica TaxID=472695 RepID=UPI0028A77904|nr:LPD7 domain-containing protein [Pantoea septica]
MKTADYPVWLAVMRDQRNAARADAGAHPDGGPAIAWDEAAQLWYARPGADLSRLQKWMPDRSIRSSGGGDPQEEFLDALTSAGLVLDGLPVMDGRRHRVPAVEGKKGNRDGVYRGFLTGVKPGGWFINYHRADNDQDITKWKASGSTGKTDPVARVHIRAVMRQSQDDAARKQAALYARQTASAKRLYERLPVADRDHAYLMRKGITVAEDVRQTRNGALVVPFFDADGAFRTLQYIPPTGDKYLFEDAPKSGHFRVEGGQLANGEPILYAEGYATARSLHMVTGRPVVMTIDAGNMGAVATVLKARYPDSPHLFMADVDHAKEKNKGVLSANRAAEATGGAVLLPDLTAAEIERGFTDFNDLHQSRGAERLQATLLPEIARALEGLNYKDSFMATPKDTLPVSENVPAQEPATAPLSETETTAMPATEPDASDPASVAAPAPVLTPVNAAEIEAVQTPAKAARNAGSAQAKAGEVLALSAQGMKAGQIAKELGIGQTSVYRILRAHEEATTETPAAPVAPASTPASESGGASADSGAVSTEAGPVTVISEFASDAAPESVPDAAAGYAPAAVMDATPAPERADNVARAMALSASGLSLARVAAELNLGMTETHRLIKAGKQLEATASDGPAVNVPAADSSPKVDANDFSTEFRDIAGRFRALKDEALALDSDALAWRLGMLADERTRLTEMWAMGNDTEKTDWPSRESEALEAELRAELDKRRESAPSPLQAAFGEENAILVGAPRMAPSDEDAPAAEKRERTDTDKLLSRITHEKQADGKSVLYKLDGEPAFHDRGNRLVMAEGASAHEEKVLAALLTAAHQYYGKIELTGSDEFKAFAINLIVTNNLQVSMKNASQQVALDEARRAAGQPVSPAAQADTVRGEQQPPRAAETPPTPPVTPATQAQEPQVPVPPSVPVMPSPQPVSQAAPAQEESKTSPAVHTPAEKAREPVTGKVTACGQAPFRFEPDQSESTFITLRTKEGSQTFWGKELAGLLRETNLKAGKMVTLQWLGKQNVTVNVPKKNEAGEVTHYEQVSTHRNQWSMAPKGGDRVLTGRDDMVPLSAVDVNRFTQIQHTLVSRLGLDVPAPPVPADKLYWLKPDGQGSSQSGDPLSAPRPAPDERAGVPVMSVWGNDGQLDLHLVQGDGNYLQGVVRQNGEYHHVLVSLPDSPEAPRMVINLLTAEGAQPIGSGNGINKSNGQPVPREHVVVRLTGDDKPRIAKLDAPAELPAALHARMGYDERYKSESGWVKEQPAAAPQAVPATPPRPAQ